MHIPENRQYTGCAVNFMTTTVNCKVHNNDKYDGHRHLMSIPDEKEIQAMMEEMKNNQKTLKYVS